MENEHADIPRRMGVGRLGVAPDAARLEPYAGRGTAVRHETRDDDPETAKDRELQQIRAEFGYGMWARPGLEATSRSLMTISVLTTLRATEELHLHVNTALNLGITPDELQEAFAHIGVYAGIPQWNHGLRVLRDVVAQRAALSTPPQTLEKP